MHKINYPQGLAQRLAEEGQLPQDYWVGDLVEWLRNHYRAELLLTGSVFDHESRQYRQGYSIEFLDSRQAMLFVLKYGNG